MPSQAYYEGDWYECVTAASAGQSPGTHPSKWVKLTLPEEWFNPLTSAAHAFALACRQNFEAAAAVRAGARLDQSEMALNRHRENGRGRPIKVFTR